MSYLFLINTGFKYRDSIILEKIRQNKCKITKKKYEGKIVSKQDNYENNAFNVPAIGLYLNDTDHHLSLLSKIRANESNINPFTPVTMFSNSPSDFLMGQVGVSVVLEHTFTSNLILDTIDTMTKPQTDFIMISGVYNGPERRKKNENRAFDRRKDFHEDEIRYKAKPSDNFPGRISWYKTANRKTLQNTLLAFQAQILSTKSLKERNIILTNLANTLKVWHYTPKQIEQFSGLQIGGQ